MDKESKMLKGERRQQKLDRRKGKARRANNRKALQIIIDAAARRLKPSKHQFSLPGL